MKLFKPPTFSTGQSERKATWTELFFDLAFVVGVASLGHVLIDNLTMHGFVQFLLLFVALWISWIGHTFYNDRFDTDDSIHRLLAYVQMIGVLLFSISLHDVFGETFYAVAIAYCIIRLALIISYVRVFYYIPQARPLALRYVLGFLVALSFWILGIYIPSEWGRVLFVLIALLIDITTPFTARKFQAQLPLSISHLPERFGLFTILILGESIVSVARAVEEAEENVLNTIGAIALGIGIVCILWLLYFNRHEGKVLAKVRLASQIWVYIHLPLTIALILFATALGEVLQSIHSSPNQTVGILLIISYALILLFLSVLSYVTTLNKKTCAHRVSWLRIFGSLTVLFSMLFIQSISSQLLIFILFIIGIILVVTEALIVKKESE